MNEEKDLKCKQVLSAVEEFKAKLSEMGFDCLVAASEKEPDDNDNVICCATITSRKNVYNFSSVLFSGAIDNGNQDMKAFITAILKDYSEYKKNLKKDVYNDPVNEVLMQASDQFIVVDDFENIFLEASRHGKTHSL